MLRLLLFVSVLVFGTIAFSIPGVSIKVKKIIPTKNANSTRIMLPKKKSLFMLMNWIPSKPNSISNIISSNSVNPLSITPKLSMKILEANS